MVKGRTQRMERIFHEFIAHSEAGRWSAHTARHGPVRSRCQHSLPGHGPVDSVKRPVRTRMRGVVGAGEKDPRLPDWPHIFQLIARNYGGNSLGLCLSDIAFFPL